MQRTRCSSRRLGQAAKHDAVATSRQVSKPWQDRLESSGSCPVRRVRPPAVKWNARNSNTCGKQQSLMGQAQEVRVLLASQSMCKHCCCGCAALAVSLIMEYNWQYAATPLRDSTATAANPSQVIVQAR
eukprot:GHRQ01033110.1.p1 GENE.GHRQ01033110.1~~GHRQ01033110.1.p1  ORF type:complete len:129 (+),score=19.86 GHRQ01033110.1:945-1331(+)